MMDGPSGSSSESRLVRDCGTVHGSLRLLRLAAVVMFAQGVLGVAGSDQAVMHLPIWFWASMFGLTLLIVAVVRVRHVDSGRLAWVLHGFVCGGLIMFVSTVLTVATMGMALEAGAQTPWWIEGTPSAVAGVWLVALVTSLAVYRDQLEGRLAFVRYVLLLGIVVFAAWLMSAVRMHAQVNDRYWAAGAWALVWTSLPYLLVAGLALLAYRVNVRIGGRLCSGPMLIVTTVLGFVSMALTVGWRVQVTLDRMLGAYVDVEIARLVMRLASPVMRVIFAVWALLAIGVAMRRTRTFGRCMKCGYDLTGRTGTRCPECGTVGATDEVPA